MPSAIQKIKLSSSTSGRGIKIAATATAGTALHTAVSGTTAGSFDEIWVWLTNTSAADVVATFEFGGTTSVDDHVVITVPAKSTVLGLPGLILQNSLAVACFAGTTNVLTAFGFVNRITN